ncbi:MULTISPECIES: glycosyltransferase family 4 protein [Microbacterium]|uniref:D-inositol 3-phosphate glycosyltransferase n=2 Tax=Microbacterium wangchenii TaxID=2541726 RepID=A0ABX5SSF3_9MICO|nr:MULTISPECIES: glycosyltransferase family 4 protein [Microbacterium]MCK6066760.1 glycosyltransferase family 4 protein [Microbacterium sp. EYE_512]QBR88078.1 glycosyltransferase WbuB [Microbacterium wangchenii]TXK18132.1 glycosyltransferase family 4 protein [Microbacterium wangchenii]
MPLAADGKTPAITRVVIVSRLFPPEVSAGAFRLGALARSLAERGYVVNVLSTRPPAAAPAVEDPTDVRVRRWPVLRDRGGNVRGYLQYLSFDLPLFARLLLRRFDVVVAESPPTTGFVATVVALLKRRPVVYYAADVWTDGVISMGAPRAVVSVIRGLERLVLRQARGILSVSEEVSDRLVLLGADRSRVATIGNGIDTSVFTPEIAPASPGQRYFVYTGTMSEWQQPDVFIRAFASIVDGHPDLRLKFFGQGAVEPRLRDLAGALVPGRVDFGGVISPPESAAWIRGAVAALVSIVPGIGYDFARPTKTYAAAATGTPVLFAGPAEGGELVTSAGLGTAVGFAVEDVAEGMQQLLEEQGSGETDRRRAQRAEWARKNLSLSAVADRASHVVSEVARPAPASGDRNIDTQNNPSKESD